MKLENISKGAGNNRERLIVARVHMVSFLPGNSNGNSNTRVVYHIQKFKDLLQKIYGVTFGNPFSREISLSCKDLRMCKEKNIRAKIEKGGIELRGVKNDPK